MTMSCPEVVYQAYYPYLYQRPGASASSVARTTPFPPFSHQYDRFNVQRSLEQQQPSSLDVYHAHHSSHHSSAGSVSSGGGVGSPGSPPGPPLRHKDEEQAAPRVSEGGGVDEEEEEDEDAASSRAQYVSANCVVFTHYSGDVAAVVDEHFSRALSYAADSKAQPHLKECSPMSARNFPASFWNSNYQSGVASTSGDLYADPYHPQPSGADPWHSHYQQYSAAAHHHHRAVHEYHHHHHHHNMAAQYGGLLLPPATRLPPHQYGAASTQTHLDASYGAYPAQYSHSALRHGLEAQVQESSKDLYWF